LRRQKYNFYRISQIVPISKSFFFTIEILLSSYSYQPY